MGGSSIHEPPAQRRDMTSPEQSAGWNQTAHQPGQVEVVRIELTMLTYPVLAQLHADVQLLIDGGSRHLVIDLHDVRLIDAASIGCLMDIHWLLTKKGGALRIAGPRPRVNSMLTMVGVNKVMPVHDTCADAVAAFGQASPSGTSKDGPPPQIPPHEISWTPRNV